MKSTLRTKIAAAALLLVPMGALLATQSALADQRDGWRDHAYSREIRRDHQAPQVFDITPSQGDRVSERGVTRISARFADDRSGVDARSVTLRVDGRDVTRHARVDGNDIRFADDLRPGRHFAELVVRDRAGNATRRSWSFDVVDHGRGYGYGYGRDHDRRW